MGIHKADACVGLRSWWSSSDGALQHPTRFPLGKSQPRVLGGWESPWPCSDLPSPSSSMGTCCHPCPHRAAGVLGAGCWGGSSGLCPAPSQCPWLSALGALVLFPFPTAVQHPSPTLGCAWGQDPVMLRDVGMGSHATFLASPSPSTASQCYRGGFRLGFRSPIQNSSTLGQDTPTSQSLHSSPVP